MAINTRSELEAYFKNGKKPSQKEFADLIASTLNKRDDQFFGRWRAGTTYRKGDIVIHDRALWGMHADSPICSHEAPEQGDTWWTLGMPALDEQQVLIDEIQERLSDLEERMEALENQIGS